VYGSLNRQIQQIVGFDSFVTLLLILQTRRTKMQQSSVFSALTRHAKFNKNLQQQQQKIHSSVQPQGISKIVLQEQQPHPSMSEEEEEKISDIESTSNDEDQINDDGRQDRDQVHLEEDKVRKFFKIRVKGTNPPQLLQGFHDLKEMEALSVKNVHLLLENIEGSRFKEPTPVQMQTIPCMLSSRDVLSVAPTGSGKTASYLIPRLCMLKKEEEQQGGVHTLVIVPTHELADQIVREHEWLSARFPRHLRRSCTLTRANKEAVSQSMLGKSFYGLVVTTPLLLIEVLQKIETPAQVDCVIFDEADRLFEPTFVEQTDEILSSLREQNQQRCMFSATMPSKVERLANTILRDPLKAVIGDSKSGASTIDQKLIYAGTDDGKLVAFRRYLRDGLLVPPVLIFCEGKDHAKTLLRELRIEVGDHVDAMHGERSPAQRDALVLKFREGKLWFMIATELLARGVDFRGINTVVNWDLPNSPVSYIHRIGRCGRAGRHGTSFSFFTDDDIKNQSVRAIANVVKASGSEVADWIMELKKKKTWRGGAGANKPLVDQPSNSSQKRVKVLRDEKLKKSKRLTTDNPASE
jgi:ATP-dependent RNA helicase DDX52/ROK1